MRAASEADAFFAQGFNAARDRLWQIDLWRKRGLGLLAGDLGPAYVERDRAARLLLCGSASGHATSCCGSGGTGGSWSGTMNCPDSAPGSRRAAISPSC
ncbi:MAG: penicillin acylase family protein [Acetobacteraceae bacterium]|nr:penicillin acylase family protein [Acetobacteraceae bacterium]